jgi:hypothetical protein
MENSNDLGILVGEYEENKTATGSTLLIGLVCFGLTAMLVVFFRNEAGISFNKILFAAGAVFSFLGGASCVHSFIKKRGGRVLVYENGLTVEKAGKKITARWSEIVTLREKVEKIYMNGRYLYDRYSYTIEKQDGVTFDLSNLISNIDELGRRLKEKTFEHLYPSMIAKIAGGEPVLFDSLAVDKNSLGGVSWQELAGVKLKDGVIEVKDRNGTPVVRGDYGATPNAHLLIALLRERLPLEN